MLETTIVGSLPKPAWLAQPERLWAPWSVDGTLLDSAKRDAVLLAIKEQEDIGIDIVTDGEQSRQHFVHGFLTNLSGIDLSNRKVVPIRDGRYEADCPTVVSPIARHGSAHRAEVEFARKHTQRQLKFTLPGPMTIADTVADEHYGERAALAFAFAEALNEEALDIAPYVDLIQFDEPAFNVYLADVPEWGIAALERAAQGVKCKTAVHICYGYGIKPNIDWKQSLGNEWRQYERIFPILAESKIDQVSIECMHSRVPISIIGLLKNKEVQVGAIDVASEYVESPEEIASVLRETLRYVTAEQISASTNCGMAPMQREIAYHKLRALVAGTALLRKDLG
jgi:5-methyltetrahydropteroyltriglutamate--homocysteine methyltransferase